MAEASRRRPRVYSIPLHRSFADALVNGLLARTASDRMRLARATILTASNRAARTINDAFVRRAEGGLLLPRIVPIGQAGEALAADLFDQGAEPVPPAIDPIRRQLLLARLIERGGERRGGEALRMAAELARVIDELGVERKTAGDLRDIELAEDLARHWQTSLNQLAVLIEQWPIVLDSIGCVELTERRNRLLGRASASWQDTAPPGMIIAAGVTSAAPAIADLLRVIARLPGGQVVLPGLDLGSPDEEWDAIWGGEGARPIETHPQYALRLLIERMGVARSDVVRWRWGDGRPRQAVRARQVSNAFAPAKFTAKWAELKNPLNKLRGVSLAEFATPADEAQGIAIALREVLETPGKTAALVTPDRALARRVSAHLRRWGVQADDSAGTPLSREPIGTLILAAANAIAEDFAPVPLLALLKHPLVQAAEGRNDWLAGARKLDAALRGPRPAGGLGGVTAFLSQSGDPRSERIRRAALPWWIEASQALEPLAREADALTDQLLRLGDGIRALAGEAAWAGTTGRDAAALFDDLTTHAPDGPSGVTPRELVELLSDLLSGIAVRPPAGGHHRIAIRGLIESRLQSADLVIAAGLNEGAWPAEPAPDPWLAPQVRIALGMGAAERRIGIAAHDLANVLGAPEVLLTRSLREASGPAIESRFLLRLKAMLGDQLEPDARLPHLSATLDASALPPRRVSQPAPNPPVSARPIKISVTEVDRLKADPFAFYARAILRLSLLDMVDADPGPAWRGSAVHAVFDQWFKLDGCAPEKLRPRVEDLLSGPGVHPVIRALWQPRIMEAVDWIAEQVVKDAKAGRTIADTEVSGEVEICGVTLHGRADRIDRMADGSLGIVDYKNGKPPSPGAVEQGFAMQLGLLGLIAEMGGFKPLTGSPTDFEYWSLAKNKDQFGQRKKPFKKGGELAAGNFVERSHADFEKAADKWLTGDAPYTAKLVPDFAPYDEYDQLMRLDEWLGRERAS
ncbi:ATP-dependent helicase/nuclease subunit B [Sphingomonas antarctica]|uniref:double-strand break repair protein AddB n=1 Tax=Sphingomonas antarctica TaxID=2040274 RepID=UPI0039E7E538